MTTSIKSRTKSGVEVSITYVGRRVGGVGVAADVDLVHPQHGAITVTDATWTAAGVVVGWYAGKQIALGIPKSDWGRVVEVANSDKAHRDEMTGLALASFFDGDQARGRVAYADALAVAKKTGSPQVVAQDLDGDGAQGHVFRTAYVAPDGSVTVRREEE